MEAHKTTKNRFANQETQVGMPGPYIAETDRQHNQTIPRVDRPKQKGQRKTEEYVAKNGAWRGQRSEKDLGRNQVRRQE